MNLPPVFERYRAEIDAELRTVVSQRHLPLYDMIRYHLGWIDQEGNPRSTSSGKALRPTLCLLSCEAVGGDYRQALPAAAALELIHNFSLIHDDIQDNDKERRHRSTVWYIWGKAQGINAGDTVRVLARLALLRLEERKVPCQRISQATWLLEKSCLELIEGQYLDISYEQRFDITLRDYLEMIRRKTGALIRCSVKIGALLGTENALVSERLGQFGENLGLAFQIRDDILGVWGDEKKTGKPFASDIRRKKKSLPAVYALEKAREAGIKELLNIYQKNNLEEKDISTVMDILNTLGVQDYAQSLVQKYCQQVWKEIEGLSLIPSRQQELKELAQFLAERDF